MNNLELQQSFDRAAAWLLHSGIQNASGDRANAGGFNSWYDPSLGRYQYVYSEITGYGLAALAFLYAQNPSDALRQRAELAAHWLRVEATHPCGAVLTRKYYRPEDASSDYSFESEVIYTFDNGMVVFGLMKWYALTRDEKFLNQAKKIARFLLSAQKNDGSFYPRYSARSGTFSESEEKWSTQSGSFLVKVGMGLSDLFDATAEKAYLDAARKSAEFALKKQTPDGRFISFQDTGGTHLHPHLYSCEGLLYAGERMQSSVYIDAAARGTRWALDLQLETGGLPSMVSADSRSTVERSDTLAQALRLGAYFLKQGYLGEPYKNKLRRLSDRLMSYQERGGSQDGGFRYGPAPHINAWCSMFALQAIHYLRDAEAGIATRPDYLI